MSALFFFVFCAHKYVCVVYVKVAHAAVLLVFRV